MPSFVSDSTHGMSLVFDHVGIWSFKSLYCFSGCLKACSVTMTISSHILWKLFQIASALFFVAHFEQMEKLGWKWVSTFIIMIVYCFKKERRRLHSFSQPSIIGKVLNYQYFMLLLLFLLLLSSLFPSLFLLLFLFVKLFEWETFSYVSFLFVLNYSHK